MNRINKFLIALAALVLIASTIACGVSSNSGGNTSSQGPMPGLVGKWLDPDTTGTVTTIAWQNNEYVVTSVSNPNRGGNEVTESAWANNTLTWTYCVPGGNCLTSVTVSVNGNNLDTTWTSDDGNSGTTTFQRQP
jgi:hypothetical protein